MQRGDTLYKRILWIGGAPDSGKTTIATMLADKYGLTLYEYDRWAGGVEQLDREKHPRALEWFEKTQDELWQERTPEEIARHSFDTFDEIFPVRLQEILELAKDSIVVAEGNPFVPTLVAPLISSVNQAIWLVSTEEFKRRSFHTRGKDQYSTKYGNSDPALAAHNFMMKDFIQATWVRADAAEQSLKLLEIDSIRSLDEVLAIVEAHFAPYLADSVTA